MSIFIPQRQMTHDPATHIAGVRFQKLGKLYHFDFTDFPDLIMGDFVIVETVRGLQMGEVVGFVQREDNQRAYKTLLRIATPRDLLLHQQWKAREVEALIDCREVAARLSSYQDVKFVKAEYSFDGASLTIMYTSEEEVSIGPLAAELRKRLAYHANIDFRQIGPRDVARIMGGQGACGGPRCCSTFLTDFSPISIKMAKAQGIPLNPTEITGMCGRLRCCLVYEYEQYVEARRKLPRRNKLVGTPHGEGRVLEVYPLRDGVTVEIEEQRYFVEREQIIPLEEFRALSEKATAGCTRNESGMCDCGARRPKSAQQDLKAALDMAHNIQKTPTLSDGQEDDVVGEESVTGDTKKRRKRRRRHRPTGNDKTQVSGETPAGEASVPSSEESSRSRRQHRLDRHRRRRGPRKADDGDNRPHTEGE